jgi:hypothetical protein
MIVFLDPDDAFIYYVRNRSSDDIPFYVVEEFFLANEGMFNGVKIKEDIISVLKGVMKDRYESVDNEIVDALYDMATADKKRKTYEEEEEESKDSYIDMLIDADECEDDKILERYLIQKTSQQVNKRRRKK